MPKSSTSIAQVTLLTNGLFAVLLAGCANPASFVEIARPTAYAQELASYEIRGDSSLAMAEVELTWKEQVISARTTVGSQVVHFDFDARTGELQETRYSLGPNQGVEYPWGVNRISPSLQGFSPEDPIWLARLATPIGLQWPLIGDHSGNLTWGEVQVTTASTAEAWAIFGSAPCQVLCPVGPATEGGLHMGMRGNGPGILPMEASYGIGAIGMTINRTSHTVGGAPVQVNSQSPVIPLATEGAPRCGYLPCEPAGWPSRISLQSGMDALLRSPQWISWEAQQTRPFYLSGGGIVTGGQTSFGDLILDETNFWTFEFIDFDQETRFRVQAKTLPNGDLSPPVVLDPETSRVNTLAEYYRESTFSLPLLDAGTAVEAIAQAAGKPLEEISRIEFAVNAAAINPDSRGVMSWTVYWGSYSGWTDLGTGSATTAQAFVVNHSQS